MQNRDETVIIGNDLVSPYTGIEDEYYRFFGNAYAVIEEHSKLKIKYDTPSKELDKLQNDWDKYDETARLHAQTWRDFEAAGGKTDQLPPCPHACVIHPTTLAYNMRSLNGVIHEQIEAMKSYLDNQG